MRYYIENWEKIRNKPWLEVVDEVLNALFEYVGEPKPVWLEAKVGDKEEILETVYEEMKEKVIDAINDYIINIIIEKGKRSELETRPGFWDRLNYITNLKVRAGIYALDDGKKYGLPWGRTIVITRKIIEVFLKERIQLTNLKDLANLMDWEYREAFVCRPLGIVKQPAVFAPIETFEEAETGKVDVEEITLDLTP
jgi:hypothetical protein